MHDDQRRRQVQVVGLSWNRPPRVISHPVSQLGRASVCMTPSPHPSSAVSLLPPTPNSITLTPFASSVSSISTHFLVRSPEIPLKNLSFPPCFKHAREFDTLKFSSGGVSVSSSREMKPETPLDSVLFQLDETRTRCELLIAAGELSERLASGYVTPFLSHLPTVHEQVVARGGGGGGDVIRLQAPPCPVIQGEPWFTKRTIERFVRFVSTPDVLERVNFLETERLKLAEASNILISQSSSASAIPTDSSFGSDASFKGEPATGSFQCTQTGMHSMDSLEIEAESSRRHLVNAMDARRLALEKEQRKAFARAAAAGFSIDSLRDLIAFADSFGAARLREACLQFEELHNKLNQPDPDTPTDSTTFLTNLNLSTNPTNSINSISSINCMSNSDVESHPGEIYKPGGEVRSYGRRRVWGPPVTGIPLQGVSAVRRDADGVELKDTDGALTCEDGASPINSTTPTSSDPRDSDWDEDTESSGNNPVYENVMRHPERRCVESAVQPAARRTGIVVIRNVKLPHAAAPLKQSETESDVDSGESEGDSSKAGRLSVRAAISLFETKQKQSNNVVAVKNSPKLPAGKPDQTVSRTSSEGAGNRGGKQVTKVVPVVKPTPSGSTCPPNGNTVAKSSSDIFQLVQTDAKRVDVQPAVKVEKEAAVGGSTPRAADEISKELLDRSFSCLLKINSVVQDALLSASALQQGAAQRPPAEAGIVNVESEPEWRAASSLDDMFVGGKVATTGNSRRQSLATYECTPQKTVKKVTEPAVEGTGENLKGRLYDQYQEKREAKYKRESTISKAEREAKLKSMQDVLERRRSELLNRSSRLPEKNNTLSAEQMKALKFQSMKNNDLLTSNRKEPKVVLHEKPTTKKLTSVTNRAVQQKQDSPTSRSSTRKLSPGPLPPKSSTLLTNRNSTRLTSSPRSKLSTGPTVSQRRVPSFMSQSVISESLHTQADLRKENARPPRRSNLNSYNETSTAPLKYSQSRDTTTRTLVMPLETNLVSEPRKSHVTGKPSGGQVRSGGGGGQVLAPLKIARDIAAEQNTLTSRIPRGVTTSKPARVTEPKPVYNSNVVKRSTGPLLAAETSLVSSALRSNDECIKQIVSCNSTTTKERQLHEESSDAALSIQAESLKESPELVTVVEEVNLPMKKDVVYHSTDFINQAVNHSSDFDDEMQIDDEVEKCMSGRSFLHGISASPLINNFGTAAEKECKQEMSCSLRTGPSSQSLPHLPRSISPSAVSSFRTDAPPAQVKETRTQCKEHHQQKEQQPKGLKRLLKFGRKNRSSDSNLVEWSTINEDMNESVRKSSKKSSCSTVEETPSRTSGVRRSLEALPKIADAASELSRNFFSTFRSKSSVCDSRSRA